LVQFLKAMHAVAQCNELLGGVAALLPDKTPPPKLLQGCPSQALSGREQQPATIF
jgi:hypothetical protein